VATNPTSGVTIGEAVSLVRRLEPRNAVDMTDRKLRYMAAMLGVEAGRPGATVLLDRVDLLLIRMLIRLEASGLSRPVARFAAVCIAPEVRDLLSRGRPVASVVVVPIAVSYPKVRRPVLTSLGEARKLRLGGVYVVLRELVAGIAEGIRETRTAQPTVWQWKPVEPSTAAYRVIDERREDRELTLA
jgi:hypothetical protein